MNKKKNFVETMNKLARVDINEIPKERMKQAITKGNFKEQFGIDVDCYVLDDEQKTAVISQTGMGESLGLSKRGSSLTRFLKGKNISKYLGAELLKKIEKPLIFRGVYLGANIPQIPKIYGYDVTILIDICNAILEAEKEGNLAKSQAKIARQAQILTRASAKSGIKNLVWALSGYVPEEFEVIKSFKDYLVEEQSREYAKEFPVHLYIAWSRLYNFPLKTGKNFHVKCRWLTIQHVYEPLLKSNGRLLKMLREAKIKDPSGKNKRLFQYLNEELGMPAIRKHLIQLQTISDIAKDLKEYEDNFNKLFGTQLPLPLEWDKNKQ